MKNVSVLIKVPDDLYEDVIEPKKREKSFTAFIESLLDAYYNNPSVQSIIEGSIDGLREESMQSLNAALMKASSSMSMLSLFSDELEETTQQGIRQFSSFQEDFENPVEPQVPVALLEDYQGLKEEVSFLKEQNNEIKNQNAKIVELLSKISSGTLSIVPDARNVKKQVDTKEVVETEERPKSNIQYELKSKPEPEVINSGVKVQSDLAISDDDLIDFGIVFDEEVPEEGTSSEVNAASIFADLMQDNAYAY